MACASLSGSPRELKFSLVSKYREEYLWKIGRNEKEPKGKGKKMAVTYELYAACPSQYRTFNRYSQF